MAPNLTVKVQDTYGSQTVSSVDGTPGNYSSFAATLYLKGVNSTFASYPEMQMTHEYGHVWTLHHFYLSNGGSWASYLEKRWSSANGSLLLGQDSRLDSSYTWSTSEIVADDYRMLFGTATAVSQSPHMNSTIVDPRQQPGLKDWFLSTWK